MTEFGCMRVVQIGLGGLYGDNELHERMDPTAVMKTVDSTLWKHFERFAYVLCLNSLQSYSFFAVFAVCG